MNREGAKDAKLEKEEDAVLTSRYERLRGLIIPMQPNFIKSNILSNATNVTIFDFHLL